MQCGAFFFNGEALGHSNQHWLGLFVCPTRSRLCVLYLVVTHWRHRRCGPSIVRACKSCGGGVEKEGLACRSTRRWVQKHLLPVFYYKAESASSIAKNGNRSGHKNVTQCQHLAKCYLGNKILWRLSNFSKRLAVAPHLRLPIFAHHAQAIKPAIWLIAGTVLAKLGHFQVASSNQFEELCIGSIS